jgi:cytochrome c556
MKIAFMGTVAGVLVAASTVWAAGTMTPQQIVDDRVAGMKSLIGNLKAASAATDPAVAKAELAKGLVFANSIPDKFPKGTGPGDQGVTKTRALPEIWSKPADFKAAAEALSKALQAASDAAGDKAKFDAAFGDIKKSCGGCHDQFRGKETP